MLVQEQLLLEITFLTPFAIQHDGQPLKLPSRRTEALLIYLLRNPQPQAREILVDLFWDGLPQQKALGNLRVLLANLRKALAPYVTITRQSAAVNQESAYHLDLADLEEALGGARNEIERNGMLTKTNAAKLEQTLPCYRRELLPGFYLRNGQGFAEWLMTEREWLWTQVVAALQDLSTAYLQWGDYHTGITHAQRLVTMDPLREEGHRLLMQLWAAAGQKSAALAQYERCAALLVQELAVPPQTLTTTLYEQIRDGLWHLSDMTARVIAPAQQTIAHNLPREMTPLIGRTAELAELHRYLLDPAYPLVTLVAEGGSGKTRLALAAAHQLLAVDPTPFPDGIWFVTLESLPPHVTALQGAGLRTAIATAIGQAMGLPFYGSRPVEQQLAALLQTRHCLLLLDNFEQLIPAQEATEQTSPVTESTTAVSTSAEPNAVDFVIELLEQAPGLHLLVTSRIPLDLNSEFIIRFAGLPVPLVELPPDVATYPSLQLFAERAARVTTSVPMNPPPDDQLSAIAEICRFVAGLPLGIELAAAWSASLTPVEIVLALQDNLDFLTTRRRDSPPRQRSMRVIFDYSWQLLTPAAQQLLAQIACFHGGFTLDAATAILVTESGETDGDMKPATVLAYLRHRALLQQDDTGRYHIHALLREYAAEKLAMLGNTNPSIDAVALRHSRYYLTLANQAQVQGWYTRAELAPLHIELENVRLAWQRASRQGDLVGLEQGWLGLWHLHHYSALFQEGEETFRSALEALPPQSTTAFATDPDWTVMVARLQIAHATFLNATGHYRDAIALAEPATRVAENVANVALQARGYAAWGTGLYRLGQHSVALARLTDGLTAVESAELPLVMARLHLRLANTLQLVHEFDRAHSHYAEALTLYRRHHHRPGEGEVLNALGWCSQQQHDLPEALTYLQRAEAIHRQIDNPHGRGMTLINLAVVYEQQGDYMQAFACQQQVLELLEVFNDPYQRALVNHGLGVLLSRLGDYTNAEVHYRRALALDHKLGDREGVGWTQNNLGLLYNHRGDYEEALALHQTALQTGLALGARTIQGLAWSRLGQDYYGLGELEESYDAYLEAIALQTELGQRVWAIESQSGLAATQLALGMHEEALAVVQEILDFLATSTLDSAREPLLVYWNCYQVLDAVSDPQALTLLRTAHQQLMAQADHLTEPTWQHSFLEQMKIHRALRQEYYQRSGQGATPITAN